MTESHDEGPASHIGPESCVGDREVAGEALTGVHAGRVSSCETTSTGTPTPLSEAEGHISGIDQGKMPVSPAQSQTPKTGPAGRRMRENSPHGNRETSGPPAESMGQSPRDGESAGRSEKAPSQSSDAHGPEESDDRVVPEQPAKENVRDYWTFYERVSAVMVRRQDDEPAAAGGRRSTEGNTSEPAAAPTQSGKHAAPCGLERVREAARKDKRAKFTALLHHVTIDLLRESYDALKRNVAPGVDGVTWQEYEEGLEDRLVDLHCRVHRGTYRAQPSKRAYIPKPDGRLRPLGIAALEDKIVQQAVVRVLNAIYECDFLGFSYGFRPGRSQHDALDALQVTHVCARKRWSGGFIVKRWSSRKRLRARLVALKESLKRIRHTPVSEQAKWLARVFIGWMNYHAVPGNLHRVCQFRTAAIRLWLKSLRRRSQRHRLTWERFGPIANLLIPAAHVVHGYPNDRFYAKHPK